jgi:hypothetical protein
MELILPPEESHLDIRSWKAIFALQIIVIPKNRFVLHQLIQCAQWANNLTLKPRKKKKKKKRFFNCKPLFKTCLARES